MIKHFYHTTILADGRVVTGRMAIAIRGVSVVIRQLAGVAPRPAHVLLAAYQFPELIRLANAAATDRTERWRIQKVYGASGAVNYRVRVERDPDVADYPVTSELHVSLAGKLNEGGKIRLEDFAALVERAANEGPDGIECSVSEAAIYDGLSAEWSSHPVLLGD